MGGLTGARLRRGTSGSFDTVDSVDASLTAAVVDKSEPGHGTLVSQAFERLFWGGHVVLLGDVGDRERIFLHLIEGEGGDATGAGRSEEVLAKDLLVVRGGKEPRHGVLVPVHGERKWGNGVQLPLSPRIIHQRTSQVVECCCRQVSTNEDIEQAKQSTHPWHR